MPDPLLRLEQVTRRFGETVAADRVTLSVGRGEFFTLWSCPGFVDTSPL